MNDRTGKIRKVVECGTLFWEGLQKDGKGVERGEERGGRGCGGSGLKS